MAGKSSASVPSKKRKSSNRGGKSAVDKNSAVDGKTWTTVEQKEFLWDMYKTYMSFVPEKKYQAFWTILEKEWKDRWPEINTIVEFAGKKEHELTAAELVQLANAKEARLSQLKSWYRWRVPPMHARDLLKQNTKLEDSIQALVSRQRALRPYELYSQMFRERFEDVLQAQYKEQPNADPGERLKIWRDVAKKCYMNEDEDIRAAVINELEECVARRKQGIGAENTPQTYLQAIRDLNAVIGRYFDILANKTGWSFTILMGGPHPTNVGRGIEVMSHSIGENHNGKLFPEVMKGFDDVVMQQWLNHLKLVYPPAVCAERMLTSKSLTSEVPVPGLDELAQFEEGPLSHNIAQASVDNSKGNQDSSKDGEDEDGARRDAETSASTGLSATDRTDQRPIANTSFTDLLPTSPYIDNAERGLTSADRLTPASNAVAASTILTDLSANGQQSITNASFTDLLSASPYIGNAECGLTSADRLTPASYAVTASGRDTTGLEITAPDSNITDLSFAFGPDSFDFSMYDQGPSVLDNANLPFFPNLTFDQTGSNSFTSANSGTTDFGAYPGLGLFPDSNYNQFPALSASNTAPPAANPNATAAVPNPTPTIPNATAAVSNPTPTPHNAMATFPTVSNPASPNVTMPNAPVCSASPTTTTGSAASVANPSHLPIVLVHDPPISVPLTITPQASAALESNCNSVNSTRSLPTSVTPLPQATGHLTTSRGRPIKPPQHAEQMNRIGSAKPFQPSEKENIDPTTKGIDPKPDWLEIAKHYLEKLDFGGDWAVCVLAWLALEENLDKKTGTLPLPKQRPEEWTKWVNKTSHGRRGGYEQAPDIESALEFGSVIMKWWYDIQPDFRKVVGSLHPAPVFMPPAQTSVDVWAPLKKGGPNGLVIILVLLSWWAHAAKQENRWEDDSMPAWQKTVADVRLVLDALRLCTAVSCKAGTKRAGEASSSQKKKRKMA